MASHSGALWPDNSNLLFCQSGHNYFAFPYFTLGLHGSGKNKQKAQPFHRITGHMQMGAMSGQGHRRTIVCAGWKVGVAQVSRVKCQKESTGSYISIQLKCVLNFPFCPNKDVFFLIHVNQTRSLTTLSTLCVMI